MPRELLSPAGGMHADGHVRLIEHQLAQIATALGLAAALGRTLVLPPVTRLPCLTSQGEGVARSRPPPLRESP